MNIFKKEQLYDLYSPSARYMGTHALSRPIAAPTITLPAIIVVLRRKQ